MANSRDEEHAGRDYREYDICKGQRHVGCVSVARAKRGVIACTAAAGSQAKVKVHGDCVGWVHGQEGEVRYQ